MLAQCKDYRLVVMFLHLICILSYRLALQDISLAFLAGYPPSLAYKLHMRRARCLQELGEYSSAEHSAKECIDTVADAKMDEESKDKIRETMKKFIKDF